MVLISNILENIMKNIYYETLPKTLENIISNIYYDNYNKDFRK